MADSDKDPGESAKDITAAVVVIGIPVAAIVVFGTMGGLWDWALRATPTWIWVTVTFLAFVYFCWLTIKVNRINEQQQEILRLLTERRTEGGDSEPKGK